MTNFQDSILADFSLGLPAALSAKCYVYTASYVALCRGIPYNIAIILLSHESLTIVFSQSTASLSFRRVCMPRNTSDK